MTTTIKICLVSSFNQFDGYGKHALDIACALKSYGLDVYIHGMYISADPNIRPLDYGLKVANPAGDYFDTMVLFSPPPLETDCRNLRQAIHAKKYCIYTMWEALDIPMHWPSETNKLFDRTILTTDSVYRQWCKVLPNNNALVVRAGINVKKLSQSKPHGITGPIEFLLFANDGNWERKNYTQQIRCWANVFGSSKRHHLTVKTSTSRNDVLDMVKSIGNATLRQTRYSGAELAQALLNTDCLLFITLGEGFGIPPREAAMSECAVCIGNIGDGLAPMAACPHVFSINPSGTQKQMYWSGSAIIPNHKFTWPKYDDSDICDMFRRIKRMSRDEIHDYGVKTKAHVVSTDDITLHINELVRAIL